MARAAVISIILEEPAAIQADFNQIVSDNHHLLMGRMGIPVGGGNLALISLTVVGKQGEIEAFYSRLEALPNSSVKCAVSSMEINPEDLRKGGFV